MRKITLTTTFLLLLTTNIKTPAQVDLNDSRLQDLVLEYAGKDVNNLGADIYIDLTYWRLFTTHTKGWTAGDGVYSTYLPDGNTFWSFGDSFFGLISEFRNRTRPCSLPRNAAMIQTGEHSAKDFIVLNEYCSTDPNDRELYYKGKTWLRHPNATLSDEEINNGTTDSDIFYWPGDATVIKVDGKPVLQLLVGACDNTMTRTETSLAEYSLEGTPGDGNYMKLIKLYQNVVPYSSGYGSGILEDPDGHTYLYSTEGTGWLGAWAIVARTANYDLKSTWEYYINDGNDNWAWQTAIPTEEERRRSNISNGDWVTEPSVFKYGSYYYMCTQDITNGNIYIMQSEHPWGPFKNRKTLYDVPDEHSATYNTFVHPQLSRTGEIVLSYNMNPTDITYYTKGSDGSAVENTTGGFWRNANAWGSADLYQPHFIRIFNWQKLFGVENTGPITDIGIDAYNSQQ